jgi:hypothetical protein
MRVDVAIYAVLTVLLAFVLALSPSIAAGGASGTDWGWLAVSLTAVSISLPVLAVRNPFAFATFLTLAATLCLAAMGFAIALTEVPTTGQYVRASLAGTVLACSVAYLVMGQVRRDRIPNVLRERFGRENVSESRGVQFAACGVPAGDMLEVYIQNCIGAPRTVELRFEHGALFSRRTLPVALGALEPTRLGAGEVKLVQIPIAGNEAMRGPVDIALVPRVSGPAGKRLRSWRARGLTAPTPLWVIALAMLLALPLGCYLIVWGRGGFRLVLPVSRASGRALPPSKAITLWSPEQTAERGFGRLDP